MFDNGLFLLQIAVIVGFSRLIAAAFRRFGQPQVVGETPALFSMMVCMALVTTLMATPLMDWVGVERLAATGAKNSRAGSLVK